MSDEKVTSASLLTWADGLEYMGVDDQLVAFLRAEAERREKGAFSHVWRCSNCGDVIEAADTRARWNGGAFEHACAGPQAGAFPCRDFGPRDGNEAIAALFGNDLARAQEAAKMVEAVAWWEANWRDATFYVEQSALSAGYEDKPFWWGEHSRLLRTRDPKHGHDSTGSTLPEAVSALRLKLEGEQT